MLEKRYNYINGSTVQKPLRREPSIDEKRREEQEKLKRDKIKRQKAKNVQIRWSIIQVASVFLVLGLATIIRDGQVYKMQNNLSKLGKEIKVVSAENEALKVSLLKVSSLSSIEKDATSKLGMKIAEKQDVIYVDTSKDFLGSLKTEE